MKKKRNNSKNKPEKVKGEVVSNTNEEEWHHVITVDVLEGLNRRFHVVYDSTAVGMAFDQSIKYISERAQIKGFRRGKAPKQLIEAYYKDEIEKSASSLLTHEGFLHACFENKIQPLGKPTTENAVFGLDGTFSCDITLEIKPVIEPKGYIGMELKKPEVSVDEIRLRMIEEAMGEHMVDVLIDEVRDQSIVVIDFTTTKEDGEKISSGNDQFFAITADQEPPFGKNLIGKKVGDRLVEKIVLPEDVGEHGGNVALVDITVKSTLERRKPTEEEFTKSMEAPSYKELMDAFDTKAKVEARTKELQTLEEEVISKLIESHEFDVPISWVNDEEQYLINHLRFGDKIEDNIKHYIREISERNVRRSFILEAIYDAEPDLKVTSEEFDIWLNAEAGRRNVSPLVLKKELSEQNILDGVIGSIKQKKIIGHIIGQAKIGSDEPVSGDVSIPENPFE